MEKHIYRLLKAKIRNLIYYSSIDVRPRKQYLHVMRDIRDIAIQLKLGNTSRLASNIDYVLDKVINAIPKDVKNSDLDIIVKRLKTISEIEG